MSIDLSAVVPVIEVVAALILVSSLPLESRLGLVLHHDALLELRVVVSARVAPVLGNLQGVQFFRAVGPRLEFVVGDYGSTKLKGQFMWGSIREKLLIVGKKCQLVKSDSVNQPISFGLISFKPRCYHGYRPSKHHLPSAW